MIYVIYRLVLLCILPVAQRIRPYDVLCISKACSMTFRKNQRYPTTPGGTACGRACLRCARRQAAVYAGLTVCSQAVCAGRRLYMQTCGGRKQQTSSAITGGDRGGGICGLMCAHKWGPRCAGMRTHKFQKPEKRLAAVVPRCADVRIHKCRPRCMTAAGGALCRLTACEIRRYRRRH